MVYGAAGEDVERQALIEARGRAIDARMEQHAGLFWSARLEQIMAPFVEDEVFRVQALRFIDVLPRLDDDAALLRHLHEYFGTEALKVALPVRWSLRHPRLMAPLIAQAVRRLMVLLSRRFIGGATVDEATATIESLREAGAGFSLDILGEAVVSELEADRYLRQYLALIDALAPRLAQWPEHRPIDRVDGRAGPRLYLSLKVTALHSWINPLDPEGSIAQISQRLRPILMAARHNDVFVCFDMEQYEFKEIVLAVFKTLLMEPELREWCDAGIALQAYLRDAEEDVQGLIAWAAWRGAPVTVRLVRGAYWDYESVVAGLHGWPAPVWQSKAETDRCYERCLEHLMSRYPVVRTAVASHNIRSLALAMVLADEYRLAPDQFEFQMLFGMAEPLRRAVTALGYCLRVYVPFGEAIPGMAYLVRRLLENASNHAFLQSGLMHEVDLRQQLAAPVVPSSPDRDRRPMRPVDWDLQRTSDDEFHNEPLCRFDTPQERHRFAAAIGQVRSMLGQRYPLSVDGECVQTSERIESRNPAAPKELVGSVSVAGTEHADRAVAAAAAVFSEWSATGMTERAECLLRAAARLRERRMVFAGWEIVEAGKTWREADANVTEAIDFLEYYARQAIRLDAGAANDRPGECNRYEWRPRGVGVVIPPWNFPLAILAGMTTAAIVTGNPVIVKPSSQTPVIASLFVRLLHEAGVPERVVQYLPGPGGQVGEYLARHPGIHFIAFTGSRAVGTRIIRLAARLAPGQNHFKHVVAEMGGKNAIIVDTDADLDDTVTGVVESAFGYQGQKCSACSRLIIVGPQHDRLLERLVEAVRALAIGNPADPGTRIGPVIEAAARERIQRMIEAGKKTARLVLRVDGSDCGPGYFVGPTIFSAVPPDSDLAQTEIFGPVLAVMSAASLDEALAIANHSSYALTGGFYSRSPANIERVKHEFQVGNLYINRPITGALVARQPFGGFRLSGLGCKAGGPDYLKQFVNPVTITENTLRRGFAPSRPVG